MRVVEKRQKRINSRVTARARVRSALRACSPVVPASPESVTFSLSLRSCCRSSSCSALASQSSSISLICSSQASCHARRSLSSTVLPSSRPAVVESSGMSSSMTSSGRGTGGTMAQSRRGASTEVRWRRAVRANIRIR